MKKDFIDQLVADQPTLTHRTGDTGERKKYIVYTTRRGTGNMAPEEPRSVPIKFPEGINEIEVHGPAHFPRGRWQKVYGVKISYCKPTGPQSAEPGRMIKRSKFVPLEEPAYRVQLLDRVPDEQWKRVA